jgi:hypothetical protein
MATLAQIKNRLGIIELKLNVSLTTSGEKTDWFSHFENVSRNSISIHKDLVARIKDDPNMDNLALQEEVKVSAKGEEYNSIRIIAYTPTVPPDITL